MKKITKITCLLLGLILSVPLAAQKVYYIDPEGNDNNSGTEDAPFATLVKVQEVVAPGDIVYINEGTYSISPDQAPMTTTNSNLYHCVFHLNKSGETGKPISYIANPKNSTRPVFDLSLVKPKDQRVTVFYVTGSNLYLKGFDVIGTQVTIVGHTQSEAFRIVKGANNNKYEDLKVHDGMAIGFYLLGGSNNHILNCDAYNNYDNVSDGSKGGNVDGFGAHISSSSVGEGVGTGNVFEGCRAWYNSDDGFDLINCFEAVKIINCWAFLNGYGGSKGVAAGDGTGFKAGGYGMSEDALPKVPAVIPVHEVTNSLAYYNRLRGFYANHHLGGLVFANNTAIASGVNFEMRNRELPLVLPPVDVNGYEHAIKNNLSFSGARGSTFAIQWVNKGKSKLTNNSFDAGLDMKETDFVSLDETELMAQRKSNGDLPDISFGKLTSDAELRYWGMGCFASGEASKLDFSWLKKPTIVLAGTIASVVGPNAEEFTKIYVNLDGTDQTDSFDKTADLSAYTGVLNLKATVEDKDGNIKRSIILKIKR
ncbi:right-handed parallel beta-helix repeat-containing protein [Bacteroides sp. 224]|uniref:rhamnogalacturonan lyase n=1 Tax=Bacteroides sp. 224 TaxID=2302936 RepID=UPI0013D7C473|nr:DUF4990 domain-containing protein [Bacteroides sp. 224]NDV63657.1 DUF1565 domain-containing protein [Bacteroides sp. 224]